MDFRACQDPLRGGVLSVVWGTGLGGLCCTSQGLSDGALPLTVPDRHPTPVLQVHYGVPEGSYATVPDGAPRVREFREMVMALHKQVGGATTS